MPRVRISITEQDIREKIQHRMSNYCPLQTKLILSAIATEKWEVDDDVARLYRSNWARLRGHLDVPIYASVLIPSFFAILWLWVGIVSRESREVSASLFRQGFNIGSGTEVQDTFEFKLIDRKAVEVRSSEPLKQNAVLSFLVVDHTDQLLVEHLEVPAGTEVAELGNRPIQGFRLLGIEYETPDLDHDQYLFTRSGQLMGPKSRMWSLRYDEEGKPIGITIPAEQLQRIEKTDFGIEIGFSDGLFLPGGE